MLSVHNEAFVPFLSTMEKHQHILTIYTHRHLNQCITNNPIKNWYFLKSCSLLLQLDGIKIAFNHSFNKYLLSINCMSGTDQDAY